MSVFKLPDLGEGLPEADIVEWLVNEGDEIEADQPLVSMETAKAVVEVPSPFTGKLIKQYGQAGDTIETGAPLAEFEVEGEPKADSKPAEEPKAESKPEPKPKPAKQADDGDEREDSGTVVGNMQSDDRVVNEQVSTRGGVKAVPAVRALARKMKVDLSQVTPSGKGGVITKDDVRQAAEGGTAAPKPAASQSSPAQSSQPQAAAKPAAQQAPSSTVEPRKQAPAEGYEKARGPRKAMANAMAQSHAQIVPTSLFDDADITDWEDGQDMTARLIRSLVQASKEEPTLNAWFDGDNLALKKHEHVDIGLAVDTPDGLFVPALRDAQFLNADGIRMKLNRLRREVMERSIAPEELKDYTIMLSNFGKFGGKYATPVITPPCVAIVAAGGLYEQLRMHGEEDSGLSIRNHKLIPISLTFDHRAVTGGEAARFLGHVLKDLAKPH